jgi:aryl-alcohol dehydrogenase-like predicted oxidoreductase
MRLSTDPAVDEARAVATIHAALDGGVRLLDTADVYAPNEREIGHNERLVARALATWAGDRGAVTVATKGGLRREGGRWVPDGRARHLTNACEASLRALDVPRVDLYLLHAVDPKTSLATSVRALRELQRAGLAVRVGLSNVGVDVIEAAMRIVDISAVQVRLGPLFDEAIRGGVVALCRSKGIALLAHTPFGDPSGKRRIARDPAPGRCRGRRAPTPPRRARPR